MKRLFVLLLVAGCEGSGPTPQLDSFARALVCDVPGAAFDAHGTNLEKAHIELLRVETVVGVPVNEPILTPPSQPAGDYLHVDLEGTLPGAYDVMAVGGGGRWTIKNGLGILPAPSVLQERPTGLCNAQSAQLLTVHGSGFVAIGERAPQVSIRDAQGLERFAAEGVPGECVAAVTGVVNDVQLCNTLSVTLPSGHLDPGLYVAVVTNPAPLSCSSTETRPFLVEPPPTIFAAQSTASLCQGGGTLEIKGGGFQPGATVSLGGAAPIALTQNGDSSLTAEFGYSPLFVGGEQLSLVVANPDGCRATAVQAITIAHGPLLLATDPPVAYAAVRTPVTLHLSSATPPVSSATLIAQATGTPVTLTATVDPAHPSRVIAEVPPGLAPGLYNLRFTDGSNCGTGMQGALRIVAEVGLSLHSVHPANGDRSAAQLLTITPQAGSVFAVGARVFLAPHDGGGGAILPIAAQLEGEALEALVPPGVAAGSYDIVVINPDGAVGVLDDPATPFHGYQAVEGAVPSVTRVSPQSLPPACTGCLVTLTGVGFGSGASVSATCYPAGSDTPLEPAPAFPVQGVPTDTTVVVQGDGLADLPHGSACWLRVINNDQTVKPFGEAGEPLVAASGLSPVAPGDLTLASLPSLTAVRRAPAVVAVAAAPQRRFLYALGGDGGSLASPRSDMEAAPLGLTGSGKWQLLPGSLPSGTTLAGAVAAGRFIFVVGGYDGTHSLARVTRAEVLDPAEAPRLDDLGVALDFNLAGLTGGATYYYRVAARFALADTLNPGGESLASPPLALALVTLPQGMDALLRWSPGNTAGRSVAGWRIYRGTAPDQLNEYLDVAPSTLSFIDDGSLMTASQTPLPLGALGRFHTDGVPQLNTPRTGAAVVIAPDATVGRWFIYAAFGWDSMGGTALPQSYEVMQVDGTTLGSFSQTALGAAGRWLLAGWAATPERHFSVNDRNVFFGQGTRNLTLSNFMNGDSVLEMNGGSVGGGGSLTPLPSPQPTVEVEYGYGAFSGGDRLVMVGGAMLSDRPTTRSWSAAFGAGAPQPDPWTSLTVLPEPTFLPGVAGDGPYLYVVGGGSDFFAASSGVLFGLY